MVKVQAEYDRPDAGDVPAADRPLDELYADFHVVEHGEPLPDASRAVFTELEELEVDLVDTLDVVLDVERAVRGEPA